MSFLLFPGPILREGYPANIQTSTATFQPHSISWAGTQVSWPGQPISVDNAKQLQELSSFQVGIGSSASNIFYSQDGKLIIYAIGETVFIRESDTGNIVRNLYHPHTIYCLSYGPDGNLLASADFGGSSLGVDLRVWRVSDGALLLRKFLGYYSCPVFSPDTSLLALAEAQEPKGMSIRKALDFAVVKTISDPDQKNIYGLEPNFSPNGTLLAGSSSDNIYVWNVKDWTLKHTFQDAGGVFVFAPDGNLLASLHDQKISIWNITDGTLLRTLESTSSDFQLSGPLFFLNSGEILISGLRSYDQATKRINGVKSFGLWRISDGVLIKDVRLSDEILAGTVSKDDSTLLFLVGNYGSKFIHFFAIPP